MTTVDTFGRAYDLYRRTATSRSATLLLLANLIPLIGVLFFGWSLLTILVLYWLENGIVGLWNVPKIIMAQGSVIPRASARLSAIPRSGLAIFFAFHYGMFWLVHGVFVFALPTFAGSTLGGGGLPGGSTSGLCFDGTGFPSECQGGPFGEVIWSSVLIGAIALLLSHGASFFLNYLGRGEYVTASPGGQMGAVYGRVVVLHVTIILGSFIVAFLGAPIGALLVLVVLKTAFDLGLHLRDRRRSEPAIGGLAPAAPAP